MCVCGRAHGGGIALDLARVFVHQFSAPSSQDEMANKLVRHDWVLRFDDEREQLEYAHMVVIEKVPVRGPTNEERVLLAAAWQANEVKGEGSQGQHIRFSLSEDEGKTWSPSVCLMYGLQALWSPVLFFDTTQEYLYLFYSESRKALSPGGDIKYIRSSFSSETGAANAFYSFREWESPKTILPHEAGGGVPKVRKAFAKLQTKKEDF